MTKKRRITLVSEKWLVLLIILVYAIYKSLYFNTGIFWDSITILSKPATYLFNNGLFDFHYTSALDNGDPQLVPFYIGSVWKVFGRTLFVTHLAFLPVLIAILTILYCITIKLFPLKYAPYVFALLAADPSFMSQTIGIYQDSFLVLFSLLTINSLINKNKLVLSISMLLLCLVSRRGMLLTFAFMLANFINSWFLEKDTFMKTLKMLFLPYFPAIIFVFSFIVWRLSTYGWFFTTCNTNSGQTVPFNGMLRNFAILGRWFVDNGRFTLWLAFIAIFIKLKDKTTFLKDNKFIILIFFCLLTIMCFVTIPIANQFGARYFIIHYTIFSIILAKIIIHFMSECKAKLSIIMLTLLLFGGNFWIYPEHLSQSWDSSLSNLSYFELRKQTIDYLKEQKVDIKNVGVGFPMYTQFDYVDLNSDKQHFEGLDFNKNDWAIYSNVFNCSDEDIDGYKSWILTKEFKRGGAFMRIYKKK